MQTRHPSRNLSRQLGISFIGLLFVAAVLAMAGVVLAQVFPTVLEFIAIQKAAQTSSAGQTPDEVRTLFEKASAIDDFKSVTAKDIDITKEGDRVVVS